jgi:GNAT superfamily N-acetyltransferase
VVHAHDTGCEPPCLTLLKCGCVGRHNDANTMTESSWVTAEGHLLWATDSSRSAVLEEFFRGYDRAFVLPDEREELAGFRACLELNDTDVAKAFGRTHREYVVVLTARDGGRLGGANFLATQMAEGSSGPAVSVNLNYVYVERAARGRGLLRILIREVSRLSHRAYDLAEDGLGPAIFLEQNDPFRLSEQESALDTEHSGTDQLERLAIWARLGARVIDFPYVQPALSLDQQPDDGLIYSALRFPGESIVPQYLHDHLQSFFGFSVLKGRSIESDVSCAQQLAALLSRREPLSLLPLGEALARLRSAAERPKASTFLAAMRQFRP